MIDHSMRELESFVAVAEELSFTRAAARLHLAQPPLSRHVRSLEVRLGVRLFDRTNRSVALTSAGRTFYSEVREPLLQLERASSSAKRAAAGETVRLEVGFVSSLFGPEMADVFRRFRHSHATVQLTIQDRTPTEQLRAIAEGRMDGGFLGLAPRSPPHGVTFLPWRTEALALFVPRGHRLARSERVSLKALTAEPMIAIAAEAAPAFVSKVQELCRRAGFRPRVVQEATRAQAVIAMVAAGSGLAILPRSVHRLAKDAVSMVGISDREALVSYVFAHRTGSSSAALTQFIALLASQ